MDPTEPDGPENRDDAARDRSLVDDLKALASDGRSFAEAEWTYQSQRLAHAGRTAPKILLLLLLALFFVFFALMALVMGAILALVPLIGAAVATVVVVGCLLVAAMLVLMVALNRWKRLKALVMEK